MSSVLKALIQPLRSLTGANQTGISHFHRWLAPTLRVLKRRKDAMGPELPQRRSDFIEWNYNAEIYAFGKRLGEEFNEEILKQAFIEQSFIKYQEEKQREVGIEPEIDLEDNLSLAEEGETLINNCISQYLSTTLPHLPKKYINSIHEFLMSTENLSKVSKNIGIEDLIQSEEFPVDERVLARNLKSVIQALALSSGNKRASLFVRDFVLTQLAGRDLTDFYTPEDPLLELTSTLEEQNRQPPEPRLISVVGKNTILASYQVGIYSDRVMIGRGCGESAEIAQEMAACDALWRIWGVSHQKRPFPFDNKLQQELLQSS